MGEKGKKRDEIGKILASEAKPAVAWGWGKGGGAWRHASATLSTPQTTPLGLLRLPIFFPFLNAEPGPRLLWSLTLYEISPWRKPTWLLIYGRFSLEIACIFLQDLGKIWHMITSLALYNNLGRALTMSAQALVHFLAAFFINTILAALVLFLSSSWTSQAAGHLTKTRETGIWCLLQCAIQERSLFSNYSLVRK